MRDSEKEHMRESESKRYRASWSGEINGSDFFLNVRKKDRETPGTWDRAMDKFTKKEIQRKERQVENTIDIIKEK